MTDLATTRDLLGELIAYPTVSRDSNLDMMARLSERFSDAGAEVSLQHDAGGQKANLFATLGPADAPGGIVLSGHSDVVPTEGQPWTTDPFAMTEAEGRLHGRGACDMKGFLAAALAMAPAFAARVRARPLHFAVTHDEEVGCLGAQALVGELAARGIRPEIAIIGEPTEMRVIGAHKGCCEYTTHVTGTGGHASDPDAGVNAAEYAARYVARLLTLREKLKERAPATSPFTPPWTTLNIGRIAGGTAHNVIAGTAEVAWDMRPVTPEDAEFVHADLATYIGDVLLPEMRQVAPEADIATHTVAEVTGLAAMEESAARELLLALTGENGTGTVAFGTEAGLFQRLGCSAVVCGPGSIRQAHQPDEFVTAAQLQSCLDMLHGLAGRL